MQENAPSVLLDMCWTTVNASRLISMCWTRLPAVLAHHAQQPLLVLLAAHLASLTLLLVMGLLHCLLPSILHPCLASSSGALESCGITGLPSEITYLTSLASFCVLLLSFLSSPHDLSEISEPTACPPFPQSSHSLPHSQHCLSTHTPLQPFIPL